MRRLLLLPLLLLVFGCAQNHFNVPVENYAARVKIMGVAPIIIDEDSDIRHPQKEQLISLMASANRANEYLLVKGLKETGNYFSVSMLDGDPRQLFSSLLFRREKRDDAAIQYNKYFWKSDELREYMRKNNLDALMLLVVSGLTRSDKVYSSTMLSSLAGDYNYLTLTAQILDTNGAVLWEYPNFRGRIRTYTPMLSLQYPDFNEAEANISDKAELKFKTIDGIRRGLNKKHKDWLQRETKETEVYAMQFNEMVSLIKYDSPTGEKTPPAVERPRPATPAPTPAPAVAVTPAAAKPVAAAVPEPKPAPAPEAKAAVAPEVKAPVAQEVKAPGAPEVKTPAIPADKPVESKSPVPETAAPEDDIVPALEKLN